MQIFAFEKLNFCWNSCCDNNKSNVHIQMELPKYEIHKYRAVDISFAVNMELKWIQE